MKLLFSLDYLFDKEPTLYELLEQLPWLERTSMAGKDSAQNPIENRCSLSQSQVLKKSRDTSQNYSGKVEQRHACVTSLGQCSRQHS